MSTEGEEDRSEKPVHPPSMRLAHGINPNDSRWLARFEYLLPYRVNSLYVRKFGMQRKAQL
jgi:hypothetical protein